MGNDLPGVQQPEGTPLRTKSCICCASQISASAKICPECKNYQTGWRNHLTYLAAVAGFITILSSAITFLYNQISIIVRQSTWTDRLVLIEIKGSYNLDESGFIL